MHIYTRGGILINSGPPPISSSLPRAERVRRVYKSFLIDRTVHRLWPYLVGVTTEFTPPYYFVYIQVRSLFSVRPSFSAALPRETEAMSLFSLPVTFNIIHIGTCIICSSFSKTTTRYDSRPDEYIKRILRRRQGRQQKISSVGAKLNLCYTFIGSHIFTLLYTDWHPLAPLCGRLWTRFLTT